MQSILHKFKNLLFRYQFGHRYGIGFLPSMTSVSTFIKEKGTYVGKQESSEALYTSGGEVRSAFLRNEVLTRHTYELDGRRYCYAEVKS